MELSAILAVVMAPSAILSVITGNDALIGSLRLR